MLTIRPSQPKDVAHLIAVWRNAVRATHHFLSPADFTQIEQQVLEDYLPAADLLVAVEAEDRPLGFMGLTGPHIDALFVDPAQHGSGVGRKLIDHAKSLHMTLTVEVNEQNQQAVGFYEHLGFCRLGRSATDHDGRPYPLLHMAYSGAAEAIEAEVVIGRDTFPLMSQGAGTPILFMHGALGDLRTWRPHLTLLAPRFHCFAYTQRYFGSALWRDDGPAFGVATHAADLVSVVKALEVGPVHLVAWSYAGHVAVHAALQRSDLFASIFLFEPGVRTLGLSPEEQAIFDQDAMVAFGPVFERVGAGDLDGAVRMLIDSSGGDGYYDAQPVDRRTVHHENAHTMPLLLAQELPPPTTCSDLQHLCVPVAVRWGERSRPFSKLPSRAVARCVGGDNHAEIFGVNHLWPEEDPVGFTVAIERWVTAQHPEASGA